MHLLGGIARATSWQRTGLAVFAGLFLALGQAPLSLPWGIYPAFTILALLISRATKKQAAFALWLAGATYFAASLSWIVEPFLVDVARHGWMAPFALVLMSGGLALFWAGAGALAAWLGHGLVARAMLLAAALTYTEYARSTVLTGFPWGLLAYHWVDTPVAQSLSLIGPHGLGLLSVLLGVATVLRFPFGLLASGAATLGLWVALAPPPPAAEIDRPIVRLIQPNAEQHLKWKPENLQLFFDRQLELTAKPGPRDLVVWPETAVPFLLGERPDLEANLAQAAIAPVVFGARRVERAEGGATWYNALGVVDSTGKLTAQYDKHHLVPFGEYIPLAWLLNRFGLFGLAQTAGGFGAGEGPAVLTTATLPRFQPLICYEAIFPHEMLAGTRRPEWLLHITNDAWFGTYTGPYQHLAQARARAIEQGLPLARAANTGISAMIDPWGRVTASLPLGEIGYLDATLPSARAPTLYSRFGDAIALILCVGIAGIGFAARKGHASKTE